MIADLAGSYLPGPAVSDAPQAGTDGAEAAIRALTIG